MPSLDTAMSYHRLKRAPLDDMEVFSDLRSLMDYCKDGARYDGQRVVVLNDTLGSVEYTIKNNIPIINMRGSEPIFEKVYFEGDSALTYGMLIYEHNTNESWQKEDVGFSLESGKLSLFNQLEIFRIMQPNGTKFYKFHMDRIHRLTNERTSYVWNQNYNPYIDGLDNPVSTTGPSSITAMSIVNDDGRGRWCMTDNGTITIMPNGLVNENKYITRIYIKADVYYQAWI